MLLAGDSFYVLGPNSTWEDANQAALAYGGHLVSIDNQYENDYLANSLISDGTYYYFIGLQRDYPIYFDGFGYTSPDWSWVEEGNDSTYRNWSSNQWEYGNQLAGGTVLAVSSDPSLDGYWHSVDKNLFIDTGEVAPGIIELDVVLDVSAPSMVTEGAGHFTIDIDLSIPTNLNGGDEYFFLQYFQNPIWYEIEGIQQSDLTPDSAGLTGSGYVFLASPDDPLYSEWNGNIYIPSFGGTPSPGIKLSLASDNQIEAETIEISFYSEDPDASIYPRDFIQIGETHKIEIIDTSPEGKDPITGIMDLPGRVNLKSKGVTPISLFGSNEIDVTGIDLATLGFGLSTDSYVAANSKKGSIDATFEDLNQDGHLDVSVKVDTSSLASILPQGTTAINAFGQYTNGTEILFELAGEESVLFF